MTMERDEVRGRIRSFLEREFPRPGSVLGDSTNLLDEWFVDSLGVVMTVLFLEREFGVEIRRPDIRAENFRDLETLSAWIAAKLSAAG
jgi:acyl carrier protein